jgi:hypothetical protein
LKTVPVGFLRKHGMKFYSRYIATGVPES